MKFLLALVLATSATAALAYTPDFEVSRDENNTVILAIENNSANDLVCSYKLSWFENVLSYKMHFGKVSIGANESRKVTIDNDPYARISKIKAALNCK